MPNIKQRVTEQEKTQSGTPTGMNNNFIIEKFSRPRGRNSSVNFEGKTILLLDYVVIKMLVELLEQEEKAILNVEQLTW